jgi:hypothetical protein
MGTISGHTLQNVAFQSLCSLTKLPFPCMEKTEIAVPYLFYVVELSGDEFDEYSDRYIV